MEASQKLIRIGRIRIDYLGHAQVVVIIDFNRTARSVSFGLKKAKERPAAMDYIDALKIGGGTDFLAALKAGKLPAGTPAIFLSDGEHDGDAGPVLDYLKSQRHGPMHTIAVEAPAGGVKVLGQMAALTGGSHVNVENSEGLVQVFLNLARHLGEYRSYKPDQDTISCSRVSGKLLAFGFDAVPAIQEKTALPGPIYQHKARVPGEQVHIAALDLAAATDVTIKATQKRTAQGRLAAILRNDLARAQVEFSGKDGVAPTGGSLEARTRFFDPAGKPIDPRQRKDLAAEFHLIDQEGRVLRKIPARPSTTAPTLDATLKLPSEPGHVTIRTITRDASSGFAFEAQQDRTILVQKPLRLTATPTLLKVTATEGSIAADLKVSVLNDNKVAATYTARLENQSEHLRLTSARSTNDGLHLQFEAAAAGSYRDTLLVEGSYSVALEPLRVPCEFTITARFRGLALPETRTIDLGKVLANAGRKSLTSWSIPSVDAETCKYAVDVEDLSNGSRVVPLTTDQTTISPTKQKPARLELTVEIGNVPAGEYTGTVTFKLGNGTARRQWQTKVTLTVTEPLSAAPVDFGEVEVGKVVKHTLVLSNAGAELRDLTVRKPTFMAKGGEIEVAVLDKIDRLGANQQKEIGVTLAVAPAIESRGKLEGTITVRRTDGQEMKVPVTVTVIDRGKGPCSLLVAPARIQLKAKQGDPVPFEARIKLAADAVGNSDSLTASLGLFRDAADKQVTVAVVTKWPQGTKLARLTTTTLTGKLIAPQRPGRYTGELTIESTTSGIKTISVVLDVE